MEQPLTGKLWRYFIGWKQIQGLTLVIAYYRVHGDPWECAGQEVVNDSDGLLIALLSGVPYTVVNDVSSKVHKVNVLTGGGLKSKSHVLV